MRRSDVLVVTCEHGGNKVPKEFAGLFRGQAALLATHRGWDIGALAVARSVASRLGAPLLYSEVSRLVVDLNRSAHHRGVLSEFTRVLPAPDREAVYARYYRPYRDEVEAWIRGQLGKGRGVGRRVLHLSIHSFTPELRGEVRNAELGLLYDPRRPGEARYADALADALAPGAAAVGYRVRRNYPYRGVADGFMTHLRRTLPASRYVGLEIEMNQGVVAAAAGKRRMADLLAGAVASTGS